MGFEVAVRSLLGGRDSQEDSIGVALGHAPAQINRLVDTTAHNGVLVVADGVGGQAFGELASVMAVTRFLAVAREPRAMVGRRLEAAARAAQAVVEEVAASSPEHQSMATTLLGLILEGRRLSWVSVGDSPLFLVSNRRLMRLNEDHSGAAHVIKRRLRNPLEFGTDRSHVIAHALSAQPLAHMDVAPTPILLAAGDVVIAASDGIDSLSPASLLQAAMLPTAGRIADGLLTAVTALKRPHQDNTTLGVLRITGGGPRS